MFEGWDSFYLLVGGGAGALIGTMFVVATLTAGLAPERRAHGLHVAQANVRATPAAVWADRPGSAVPSDSRSRTDT